MDEKQLKDHKISDKSDSLALKDHKQIGQEQELFFTHDIAPGAPFWLPRGMVIFKQLEKFIRELTQNAGYLETSTPIMVKSELFMQSGHWTKFGEHNMYNLSLWEDEEKEELLKKIEDELEKIGPAEHTSTKLSFTYHGYNLIAEIDHAVVKKSGEESLVETKGVRVLNLPVNYSLKPMNCPESTVLYRFRPRSYRELPLRLSEIGRLHRREKAGEVNGLLRVRQLTMDDAHLYVREDQIFDEVSSILDMMVSFYKSFGFEYEFRLATRPDTRAGDDTMWDKAEKGLTDALKKKDIKAGDKLGDGAFYGPKIDLHIKDSQGREWQLATVQLDFHQPEAFKLEYIDEEGKPQRPVMIHRAIFGSFERFIAILTEHFQGSFPLWLSPNQVQIIPIADRHLKYAQNVLEQLKSAFVRTEIDSRPEKMQGKIRDAQLQKTPYMLIVGDKEETEGTVAVRTREGKDLGAIKVIDFLAQLKSEIESKS